SKNGQCQQQCARLHQSCLLAPKPSSLLYHLAAPSRKNSLCAHDRKCNTRCSDVTPFIRGEHMDRQPEVDDITVSSSSKHLLILIL
ncbi:hypothetical protein V5799_025797, partial [Amblyomma americanum]